MKYRAVNILALDQLNCSENLTACSIPGSAVQPVSSAPSSYANSVAANTLDEEVARTVSVTSTVGRMNLTTLFITISKNMVRVVMRDLPTDEDRLAKNGTKPCCASYSTYLQPDTPATAYFNLLWR